jgi:hypothetical protein
VKEESNQSGSLIAKMNSQGEYNYSSKSNKSREELNKLDSQYRHKLGHEQRKFLQQQNERSSLNMISQSDNFGGLILNGIQTMLYQESYDLNTRFPNVKKEAN